jgi:dihydrofolate synthase/folylpolyglutamate synthase
MAAPSLEKGIDRAGSALKVTNFDTANAELEARGHTRMIFDLSRIEELLDLLGRPQAAYPAIHITGTNGKTSTARMIESLLRTHGLRTGRYTSPHLATVRERISINGEPISEEMFVEIYEDVGQVAAYLDERSTGETLTYFDMTTALALVAFARASVDVAIVEVGLGGAHDSTNVLQAGICVITPIGLDHMEWLGDTIEEIATAKAGIVHSGATLICAAQPQEAVRPLRGRCAEMAATVCREGNEFGVLSRQLIAGGQVLSLLGLGGVYVDVFVPLHGSHQAQNAAVALAAVEVFLGACDVSAVRATPSGRTVARQLDPTVVRAGFAGASSPGRLEQVASKPWIMLDAAHNPHGMSATVTALQEEFSLSKLVAVVGMLADKDVLGTLQMLEPVVDDVVCTCNSSPRALAAEHLGELANKVFGGTRVTVVRDLRDAIEAAVAIAQSDVDGPSDVGVLVTGSVVTVAEARALLVRA